MVTVEVKTKYSNKHNKKPAHGRFSNFRKFFSNKKVLVATPVAVILLSAVILLAISGDAFSSAAGNEPVVIKKVGGIVDSGSDIVNSLFKPELKQKDNLTSVLLVGVDTRSVEFTGEEFISTNPDGQWGTRNTDTIIQAIYDHTNGNITLISIPRDTGVDYEAECLEFHGSLHWVYDKGQRNNCPGGGVQVLKDVIKSVTGIEVQYHAFVTLEGFIEVVNTVGEKNADGKVGIKIDNPTNVWESYPINDSGWQSVFFPEGEIFLDGEEALKYVRSRQVTTDFGRARRQQIFLEALKDRVRSSEVLLNPKKLFELYSTFKNETIISEFNLEEIRAGVSIAQELDTSKGIVNIVLDPDLGGKEAYLNKQPHDRGGPYYMIPTHWQDCPTNYYCKVQEYINQAIKYPEIYDEKAEIFVYGSEYLAGKPNLENEIYQVFKSNNYPLDITESQYLASYQAPEGITIFDFSNGEKQSTIEFLKEKLRAKVLPAGKAPNININQEEIVIVIN